ncbi:MAG: nucleoside deaminase [Cytophagales bacterium]
MTKQEMFMARAIELSKVGMENGAGGPFGCVIVKGGVIVAEGHNEVLMNNDPTAHAEMVAIRRAYKQLNHFQLTDCEVYTSCEPCPMCLGALYWARPKAIYFANTKADAASIGFDDQFIYEELEIIPSQRKMLMLHLPMRNAFEPFQIWKEKQDKKAY